MTKLQLEACYNLHYKTVRHFVAACLRDSDEAEDITMGLFLTLSQKYPTIEFGTVINYLIVSAKSRIVDYQRRAKFWSHYKEHYSPVDFEVIDVDQKQRVRKLLDALPPKMKQAILLKYEGYSREEIAEITKTSPNTIRNNIAAAMAKLKTMVDDPDSKY